MARQFYQGKFVPSNPNKYRGDYRNICYRSSWEYKAFKFCDITTGILAWCSEETVIPYVSPLDGRLHRYFMDLKIWVKDKSGGIRIILVEIKPYAQTIPPVKKSGKRSSVYLEECKTYAVNSAKWQATTELCKVNGWSFVKWTEKDLLPNLDSGVKELKTQRDYSNKMKKAFKRKASPKIELMASHLKTKIKEQLGK